MVLKTNTQNYMDILECCEMIDKNVGRSIWIEIKRMGSEQIEKIEGKIKTAFSNEIAPVCLIETATKKLEEVFLGEILQAKIVA